MEGLIGMGNSKKSLIFHLYPLLGREENWHWHLHVIRQNRGLFDGKIVISTVAGPKLAPPDSVAKLLPDNVEFRHYPNDSKFGEMVTFYDQIDSVLLEGGWTLRAHSKGVTKPQDSLETIWAEAMWASCLMSVPGSEEKSHTMGPMRIAESEGTPVWPHGWFFAGTFFWFRNSAVSSREWRRPFKDKWFVEWWPGEVFSIHESKCTFYEMKHRREFMEGQKRIFFLNQAKLEYKKFLIKNK